jgi:hypothetical protein
MYLNSYPAPCYLFIFKQLNTVLAFISYNNNNVSVEVLYPTFFNVYGEGWKTVARADEMALNICIVPIRHLHSNLSLLLFLIILIMSVLK